MPASACRAAIDLLPDRVAGLFTAEGVEVAPEDVEVMVSPRRIAVLMKECRASRPLARSPSEGRPSRPPSMPTATHQRRRRLRAGQGRQPADLEVREEPGRRFVYYVTRSESRPTAGLLPEICLKIVRDMYFPKNMRWGYRDLRFSRPVRWLVALWGETVIPFGIAGLTSGRTSHGHRWLGGPVEIARPADYVAAMSVGQGHGGPPRARADDVGGTGAHGRRAGLEVDRSQRQDGRGPFPGGVAHGGEGLFAPASSGAALRGAR